MGRRSSQDANEDAVGTAVSFVLLERLVDACVLWLDLLCFFFALLRWYFRQVRQKIRRRVEWWIFFGARRLGINAFMQTEAVKNIACGVALSRTPHPRQVLAAAESHQPRPGLQPGQ